MTTNRVVSACESDIETRMQFSPGLDQETLAETERLLTAEINDQIDGMDEEDKAKHFPAGRYSISHGDRSTTVTARQNHFGQHRHHNLEQFLAAASVALKAKNIDVELVIEPKDFKQQNELG